MSMLPYFLRDMVRPLRMIEHQMRLADEMFNNNSRFLYPSLMRHIARDEDETEKVLQDKDKLQVKLDVQHFAPHEITVKAAGNAIVVEAKHQEKEDEKGFISRQFVRRFVLPDGHDLKNVYSTLSTDGILTVTAPKKAEAERDIPISQTGPERVEQKEEKEQQQKIAQKNE